MTTADTDDEWPPPGCPPLAWPQLNDETARLDWYRAVIAAYAALWEDHATQPCLAPASEAAIAALEQRIGCALPPPLRRYHEVLGAVSLADNDSDLALAASLIAFGDYLGNGNKFCFHRETGEVCYFDHDDPPMLTRFFASVEHYLDALLIRSLAEVHGDDAAGEALGDVQSPAPLPRRPSPILHLQIANICNNLFVISINQYLFSICKWRIWCHHVPSKVEPSDRTSPTGLSRSAALIHRARFVAYLCCARQ